MHQISPLDVCAMPNKVKGCMPDYSMSLHFKQLVKVGSSKLQLVTNWTNRALECINDGIRPCHVPDDSDALEL